MYGGIYAGPALSESEDVPVVRYQDLHRTHAPASAGSPEFGMVAFDGQDFGSAREDAEYAAPFTFQDPTDERYAYRVDLDATPPSAEVTKAPMGRYTGVVTAKSDPVAYNNIIRSGTDEWARRQSGGGRGPVAEKDDDGGFDWSALASAVGKGITRGVQGPQKPSAGAFAPSGRDTRPVQGGGAVQRGAESDTLKYVLIGGAALLGVGLIAATVSSVSRARATE